MMKKGFAMEELVKIVIPIIVLLIIGAVLLTKYGPLGKKTTELADFDDCDKDKVANYFDKCPCLSTAGAEEEALPGCPKGTSIAQAQQDMQSCGKPDPACLLENKEDCPTHCQNVLGKAIELPSAEITGRAGDWDVIITTFYTKVDSAEQTQHVIDLENQEEGEVSVSFTLKNGGTQSFIESVKAQIEICDLDKRNCRSTDSVTTLPGMQGGSEVSLGETITVGKQDACDGQGEVRCYLKLVADKDGSLNEGAAGEQNNEAFIFLILKNQKFQEFGFTKYKSIEIFGGDDGSASPQQAIIRQTCLGFVGRDCEAAGGCQGDFPTELTTRGCWVMISEDDTLTDPDDCGQAAAEEGFVLDSLAYKQINHYGYLTNTNEDEPKNLLEWQWKGSTGSLLCKQGEWYLCSASANDQLLLAGSARYRCGNNRWIPS